MLKFGSIDVNDMFVLMYMLEIDNLTDVERYLRIFDEYLNEDLNFLLNIARYLCL